MDKHREIYVYIPGTLEEDPWNLRRRCYRWTDEIALTRDLSFLCRSRMRDFSPSSSRSLLDLSALKENFRCYKFVSILTILID